MEIFGSHNIRRGHRPTFWNLDVLLLENHFAGFAGDRRGPVFPFDGVEGRRPFACEAPSKFKPFLGIGQTSVSIGLSFQDFLFHGVFSSLAMTAGKSK